LHLHQGLVGGDVDPGLLPARVAQVQRGGGRQHGLSPTTARVIDVQRARCANSTGQRDEDVSSRVGFRDGAAAGRAVGETREQGLDVTVAGLEIEGSVISVGEREWVS
jgi:hypothetical protein